MDDFRCTACGSPAVTFPKVLDERALVACAGCEQVVSTYGEFKQRAERAILLSPRRARVTGC